MKKRNATDKLSLIVKESQAHWDRLGKPYPEHLQAAIDQLGYGQDRDKESERTRDLTSGPLAGDRK